MSLKKQFLKSKDICKVTFSLTKEEMLNVKELNVVGEFNNWSHTENQLTKFKNGNFKTTIDLEKGKQFEFKYLIDGKTWVNDANADFSVANDQGGENSVVVTKQ